MICCEYIWSDLFFCSSCLLICWSNTQKGTHFILKCFLFFPFISVWNKLVEKLFFWSCVSLLFLHFSLSELDWNQQSSFYFRIRAELQHVDTCCSSAVDRNAFFFWIHFWSCEIYTLLFVVKPLLFGAISAIFTAPLTPVRGCCVRRACKVCLVHAVRPCVHFGSVRVHVGHVGLMKWICNRPEAAAVFRRWVYQNGTDRTRFTDDS